MNELTRLMLSFPRLSWMTVLGLSIALAIGNCIKLLSDDPNRLYFAVHILILLFIIAVLLIGGRRVFFPFRPQVAADCQAGVPRPLATGEIASSRAAAGQPLEKAWLLRDQQYRAMIGLLAHNESEDSLLPFILRDTLEFLHTSHGFISLLEQDGSCFRIHAAQGLQEPMLGECWPLEGLCSEVYRSGNLIHVGDYQKYDKRTTDPRLRQLSSIIMAPLSSQGKVVGVFAACWIDTMHPISQEDIDVLQQYSDLASIALESAESRAKIRYMAYHDTLTGLPNRAALKTRLDSELSKAGRGEAYGTLMFIDLDDLKMVNDTFGHTYGDAIIIRAGAIIVAGVEPEALVCRLSGDEFLVLLPGESDRQVVGKIANQMIELLNMEYQVAGVSLYLSASIGIAVYPTDGITASDILKNADNAMYAAKQAGKNCWRFYEPRMQTEAYETIVITNGLRNAIARDELILHFQPQVNIVTGQVSGFEALLRWNSQEHGWIMPGRFIPLAEQSGLIQPIGEWVIQQACRYVRELNQMGYDHCYVAVNVSPRQLIDPDFVSFVGAAVQEAGIAPKQLEIEITESVVLASLEEGIAKLSQLKAMGVRLSLDDFGTGYSSLTHLQRLPVDIVKIDKTFIDSVPYDPQRSQLVKAIIDMAHGLGLKVVAEGVETREQYQRLGIYGCDYAQGYYISRPVPAREANSFLDSRQLTLESVQ